MNERQLKTKVIPLSHDLALKVIGSDEAIEFLGGAEKIYCGTDGEGNDHHCYRQPAEPLVDWCNRALDIQARYISAGDPLQTLKRPS